MKITKKKKKKKEEHSERELQIMIWYLQVYSSEAIQNPVKHPRRSFFGKIADEYKPLANYICKKTPSCMFDRVLNTSMKFM